jgi:hypothetical protein
MRTPTRSKINAAATKNANPPNASGTIHIKIGYEPPGKLSAVLMKYQ